MFEIEHYLIETGHNPFANWYIGLKDRKVKQAIDRRLNRMAFGNFGDCKPCQDGVWELRIDVGPGSAGGCITRGQGKPYYCRCAAATSGHNRLD